MQGFFGGSYPTKAIAVRYTLNLTGHGVTIHPARMNGEAKGGPYGVSRQRGGS
jgi:hypothetical protein